MLHDLLCALSGNSGSIFKESLGKLEVVPGLPFLAPNEETVLNQLLLLGSKYLFFSKFIKAHSVFAKNSGDGDLDSLKPGWYLKAFCYGLGSVLSNYQNCLLELEKDIVEDPHLSLLHFQQKTEKFHSMFIVLHDIINTIKARKSHGCQILNVLYRSSCSGNGLVKEVILQIIASCHNVMYKQLSSWLLHGLLIDNYNEFFIINSPSSIDSKDVKISRCTENQMNEFEVDINFLPSYIPIRLAKVICFVGSSLHLFKCEGSCLENLKAQSLDQIHFFVNIQEIMSKKQEQFFSDIYKLQQANAFILEEFEICIDNIRSAVAKELWKLCVEQGQLSSYLNMFKDFLLLGRGELFLSFIDDVGTLLKGPPTRVAAHDVQQIFLRSVAKIQIEDEMPFQLFQLSLQPKSDEKASFFNIYTVDDGWSRLGMTIKIKWPLHTIFKPSILEKYNHLFRFLLKVKRTQIALQRIWSLQMREQQTSDIFNNTLTSYSQFSCEMMQWQCRNHMQFFIDNLQYFLQADVLESHYTQLLNKVNADDERLHDFESITMSHENFVNALLSQCFLMSGTVCTSLIEIMDICQQFCDIIVTSSLLVSKEDTHKQIENLWQLYLRKVYMFFQVLSGVSSTQCNPHLSQLTLRLDYNRYFSTMISERKVSRSCS